ncbi:MAG: glycosyltransferase family 1 protein [Patescibacteria group bacterium]
MQPARIGIDCRLGGLRHAGIGRYIVELVSRLVTDGSFSWVLFCTDQEQVTEILGNKPPSNVKVVLAPIPHYTVQEQLKMPRIFNKEQLDLLHIPHFNAPILYTGPYVLTVHDLLWHEHRGAQVTTLSWYSYWFKYIAYRVITRTAIYQAQHICVPSQTVAQAVSNHYAFAKDKLTVTKEGIATALKSQVELVKKLPRKQHHLLYVGSLYPHKNIARVIDALHQLPKYHLTIVSSRSAFRDQVAASVSKQLRNRVSFIDATSDAKLAQQYATASALVQPSFSEGFGLTGLEAMAFNTPVIASDIAIFREIYGSAALYFSPSFTPSLVKTIKQLEDTSTQQAVLKASKHVRAQYSWDETTQKTKAIFIQLLKK